MRPKTKKMRVRDNKPTGMCPNMTAPVKVKPRKKPNPYRAPNTVKRYYAGIDYGIHLLRDELLKTLKEKELLTAELEKEIKSSSKILAITSSRKLTELEKQKTKQKLKEWEEKEWERI